MSGVLQLGDLSWRVDPNSVDWNFQVDTAVIDTLGGQVVQLLGATLSDLTITGDFGQDHRNVKLSWQLAAAFHQKIKELMDRQTLPAKTVKTTDTSAAHAGVRRTGILSDAGIIHAPLPLTYHDGKHNWKFQCLVKAFTDGDGKGSLTITNGKFAYKYVLTLFIVSTESTKINKVASDLFLNRLSDGLGWKRSDFNGPLGAADALTTVSANGGTVAAYLDKVLTGQPVATGIPGTPAAPATRPPVPRKP